MYSGDRSLPVRDSNGQRLCCDVHMRERERTRATTEDRETKKKR
jgi:hypothetical protein